MDQCPETNLPPLQSGKKSPTCCMNPLLSVLLTQLWVTVLFQGTLSTALNTVKQVVYLFVLWMGIIIIFPAIIITMFDFGITSTLYSGQHVTELIILFVLPLIISSSGLSNTLLSLAVLLMNVSQSYVCYLHPQLCMRSPSNN